MKRLFIHAQLLVVSVVLLATFGMAISLSVRFNRRWDFTKEKIYSLSPQTTAVLQKLQAGNIDVQAFYPHDDPARETFEFFLKECRLKNRGFIYNFYDPDRFPKLAKEQQVEQFYTVVIHYQGRTERLVGPTEENFTSALLRLANPRKFTLCFTQGHGESPVNAPDRTGLSLIKSKLESYNYTLQEIILNRDKIPDSCDVAVVSGPHTEFDTQELELLRAAFKSGTGIFFLIDPMDAGEGKSFRDFMRSFGVDLGDNVVVDKMSRVVGGDFLVPLVAQYVTQHPITQQFNQPTFFPVVRSVQPSTEPVGGLEVVPLALTGSGSWAESNLPELEKGQAAFDASGDISGPICIAAAVEGEEQGGRMVVAGDSDFITDAYFQLSGNSALAMNIFRWLVRDDRFVSLPSRQPEFRPLFLNANQRVKMLAATLGIVPFGILFLGIFWNIWRKRSA